MVVLNGKRQTEPKPVTNWAPIAGSWSFEDGGALYRGPTGLPPSSVSYGLALADIQMREGTVRTFIEWQAPMDTWGGIVLGYQTLRAPYVIAQLGVYNDRAYAISEFDAAFGWRPLVSAGSTQNLRPERRYALEVTQEGQKITLKVDGVRIFEHLLGSPLQGNQIGLFAFGENPVRFGPVTVEASLAKVFVAMPFTQPFDTLYQEVIRPEAESLGFDVVRIDEVTGPGIIFEDIKREIAEAKVVIAEITAPNQNVFYELGYSHALNKPTILLARRGQELPFDIRSYRVIFYEDSIGGTPVVEKTLRKHLHSILKDL